jgi:hypothetical protein
MYYFKNLVEFVIPVMLSYVFCAGYILTALAINQSFIPSIFQFSVENFCTVHIEEVEFSRRK